MTLGQAFLTPGTWAVPGAWNLEPPGAPQPGSQATGRPLEGLALALGQLQEHQPAGLVISLPVKTSETDDFTGFPEPEFDVTRSVSLSLGLTLSLTLRLSLSLSLSLSVSPSLSLSLSLSLGLGSLSLGSLSFLKPEA